MKEREFRAAVSRIMKDFNVAHFTFEEGGKHPKVCFEAGGRTHKIPYPKTASDHRSMQNNLSTIKRTLRTYH